MSTFEAEFGSKLVNENGEVDTSTELSDCDAVGIYFSAHWCPPCRGFTPKLAESYKKIVSQGKKFKIVFVSSDQDETAFKSYFKEMPWLALPFVDRAQKQKLSTKYGVRGIPTLVILDKQGNTITQDGRSTIMNDPTGQNFPWNK